jgi:5-methylcytosine-specific restriction endonuclease McrA
MPSQGKPDKERLDRIVAEARRQRDERESGYRARALHLLPWVCARCARSFSRADVQLLTVHHKDHNHEHNPPDGSNWELLCVYCHENEHRRYLDSAGRSDARSAAPPSTYRPFGELQALLRRKP